MDTKHIYGHFVFICICMDTLIFRMDMYGYSLCVKYGHIASFCMDTPYYFV